MNYTDLIGTCISTDLKYVVWRLHDCMQASVINGKEYQKNTVLMIQFHYTAKPANGPLKFMAVK